MIVQRIPDQPAQPLSEADYALLLAHCQQTLSPYFEPILPARHLQDSKTQDVLEMYVGCPEMTYNINWRGDDKGKILPQDPAAAKEPPIRATLPATPAKNAWKDGQEGKALASWITGVVRAVGGVEWFRTGGNRLIVTIAIPVEKIVAPEEAEAMKKMTGLKLVCSVAQ